MEKIFKVGTLLYVDENRIAKAMTDLKEFASMLNQEISKFVEAGYITVDEVSDEIVSELSRFEAPSIIEIVSEHYKCEANKTSYAPARNQFLKNLNMAIDAIEEQLSDARMRYEREKLSKGYYLDVQSRMQYFVISEHSVVVDEAKVSEMHSIRIDSEVKAEFANKVYLLVEEMEALSTQLLDSQRARKKAKLISRDDDSVISFGKDGNVFLDKEVLAFINFE